MFSTGGPLLVWALGQSLPEQARLSRDAFLCLARARQRAHCGVRALGDRFDGGTLRATAALVPVLTIALAAGE